MDPQGKVLGQFRASGVRPRFCERLRSFGVEVDERLFDPDFNAG
jgi:pilus assembly protein CpaF